jgi:hypothetical protein
MGKNAFSKLNIGKKQGVRIRGKALKIAGLAVHDLALAALPANRRRCEPDRLKLYRANLDNRPIFQILTLSGFAEFSGSGRT